MINRELVIILIVLMGAAAILAIWMRRDRGGEPQDRLADALHEPLDGREGA